jgi:hypothetical protein
VHGLFVFRAIDRFLEALMASMLCDRKLRQYGQSRRMQIAGQISQLGPFYDCADLTEFGGRFVASLIKQPPNLGLHERQRRRLVLDSCLSL